MTFDTSAVAHRFAPILIFATLVTVAAAAIAPPAGAAGLSRLIAPASACPGQTHPTDPPGAQARAMRCMTEFARERDGVGPLADVAALDRAARQKSADILRCDEFSHEACGRPFDFWIRRAGYPVGGCGSEGENIAWGSGSLGSVRSIFTAWIHSPGHRRNILEPAFGDFGVGLRAGRLEGHRGAHVWVQEFAGSC